jgi:hypothetical protein
MRLTLIFITVFAIMASAKVMAQKNAVTLLIDGKKTGERIITDNPAIITVNKMRYKKVSEITLILKQTPANNIYKKTIQVTDENESVLFEVNEVRSKHGWYKINIPGIKQKLMNQKIIKVLLAENPANDMMKMLSKRTLLAEVHFK